MLKRFYKYKTGRIPKNIVAVTFIIFLMNVIGCATPSRLPDVPIQRANQYDLWKNHDGLEVAVIPYIEKQKLNEFFGKNLLYEGILPILVVVDNNTNYPFLVLRENAALFTSDKETTKEGSTLANAPLQSQINKRGAALLTTYSAGALFPILLVPAALATPFTAKADADAVSTMQSISRKMMLDRSIYKGESHHGFFYYRFKIREDIRRTERLQVKIKNLLTDDISIFEFDISHIMENIKFK